VRFIAAKSNAGERQACCRMIASSWSFLIPAIGASAAAPPPSTPSERFAIYRKSIQLQRRARNGKEGTWTTRLKKFLCAAIFDSCFVAIRNASNYRLADAHDFSFNRILTLDFKSAIKNRATPVKAKWRRVGPSASKINAWRSGDVDLVTLPTGYRVVFASHSSFEHSFLNISEGITDADSSLLRQARAF
jgi:hypothetical protein